MAQTEVLGDASGARLNPFGYLGTKREVTNAVLFPVSNAASYITDQVLLVDGGAAIDLYGTRLTPAA